MEKEGERLLFVGLPDSTVTFIIAQFPGQQHQWSLVPLHMGFLTLSLPQDTCIVFWHCAAFYQLTPQPKQKKLYGWRKRLYPRKVLCLAGRGLELFPRSAICFHCNVSKWRCSQTWPPISFHSFFWQLGPDLSRTLAFWVLLAGTERVREKFQCSSPEGIRERLYKVVAHLQVVTSGPVSVGRSMNTCRAKEEVTHRS